MLIDLDRALVRSSGHKFDELVERAYWRRIEPGLALVHPIAAHIPGSGETVQCRSIAGLMVYLSADNYPSCNADVRLEKRIAIAVHAAEPHAERGEDVCIIVGDSVVLSNTDGEKRGAVYDSTNERTLLASLLRNRDLRLWERSDSRVLRGSRTSNAVNNPSCANCAFLRQSGNRGSLLYDRYCHSDLHSVKADRGQHCTEFYPASVQNRPSSARYIAVKSHDIWIPSWSEIPTLCFDVQNGTK